MATHTLIHFTPEHGDLRVDGYQNLDDALEVAKKLDGTRLVYLSVEDDEAPNGVRLFKVDRTESGDAIHVDPTGPQATTLHNVLAERPVARFATRTAAIEKTTKLLSAMVIAEKLGREEESKVEAQVAEQTEAPKSRGGRKQTHSDEMIVVLKVEKNPKRDGSATHGRFAAMMKVLKSGKATVADVLATGVTRGDLAYDEAHRYIEIVKA